MIRAHHNSEANYIAAVEEHLQDAGKYYDDLLPIQATDVDFLKGFYALCRAGFTKGTPVEQIGFWVITVVEDYRRLGRESALILLEESVRITLTGTLLNEYRSEVLTLERTVPADIAKNTLGSGRPISRSFNRGSEPAQFDGKQQGRVRQLLSRSTIGSFVGAWLVVLLIGVAQLAAVNEGLMSWGAHWAIAMFLAPPLGLIPIVGTIIGSFGAVEWGVHPILAVVFLLLPGRRQFIRYVLARGRGKS